MGVTLGLKALSHRVHLVRAVIIPLWTTLLEVATSTDAAVDLPVSLLVRHLIIVAALAVRVRVRLVESNIRVLQELFTLSLLGFGKFFSFLHVIEGVDVLQLAI